MKVLQRLGIVLENGATPSTPSRRVGATMIPQGTGLDIMAYFKVVRGLPAVSAPRVECYRAEDDLPAADRGLEKGPSPLAPLHFRLPALNLSRAPEVAPLELDKRALRYIKAIENKAGRISFEDVSPLLVSVRDNGKQLKNNWFINQLALVHYFIDRGNSEAAQDLLGLVVENVGTLKNSEDRAAFAAIATHYQAQCEADL